MLLNKSPKKSFDEDSTKNSINIKVPCLAKDLKSDTKFNSY